MATEDDERAFAAEQSSERRAGSFPNLRSGCPRNSLEHVRLGHELGCVSWTEAFGQGWRYRPLETVNQARIRSADRWEIAGCNVDFHCELSDLTLEQIPKN